MTETYTALTETVYYILLALLEPNHGYGIMQDVEQLSEGRLKLAAGTLYGALTTLVERGWIRTLPNPIESRRINYQIEPAGHQALNHELNRLEELLANGKKLLKEQK